MRLPGFQEEDWARLGRAVYAARLQAGHYNTVEWAQTVGVSYRWILGLERGERVGARALERVERALDWPPQTAFEILRGARTAADAQEAAQSPQPAVSGSLVTAELATEIVKLLNSAGSALDRPLTVDEVRDMDAVARTLRQLATSRDHPTAVVTSRLLELAAQFSALIDGDTAEAGFTTDAAEKTVESH